MIDAKQDLDEMDRPECLTASSRETKGKPGKEREINVKIESEPRENESAKKEEEKLTPYQVWINVVFLSLIYAFGLGGVFLQFSATTFLLQEFGFPGLTTIPGGTTMLMTAVSAFFVPGLCDRFGIRKVYSVCCITGIIGAGIQIVAVTVAKDSKAGFLSCIILGAFTQGPIFAATNNTRLAVSRLVDKKDQGKAVALVVLGGVIASLLGPQVSKYTKNWLHDEYAGVYVQMILLYCGFFISTWLLSHKFSKKTYHEQMKAQTPIEKLKRRSMGEIFKKTNLGLLIFLQAISYMSMASLMGVTPQAMSDSGYTFGQSNTAMLIHMLGMFLPSLVTGYLIDLIGNFTICFLGFALMLVGIGIFALEAYGTYICGILLVGVGWNLSFVGASAGVPAVYSSTPHEKSRVDSVNDTIVFASMGIVSTASGILFDSLGKPAYLYLFGGITIVAIILSFLEMIKVCKNK